MAIPLRRPLFEDIKDERVRESIQWLYEYLIAQQILTTNFQFFSVTVTAAVTALLVPHNLGFRPKDIILTSVTNNRTATFIYDSFTATNISLTTSGACTVRFFGGSYGA